MKKIIGMIFLISTISGFADRKYQVTGALNTSWRENTDKEKYDGRIDIKACIIQKQTYEVFVGGRFFNWNSTHLFEVKHDSLGIYLNRWMTYYTLVDSKARYISGIADVSWKKSVSPIELFFGLESSLNFMVSEKLENSERLNRCFESTRAVVPRDTTKYCPGEQGHYDRGQLYPVVLNMGIKAGIKFPILKTKILIYPEIERNITTFRNSENDGPYSSRALIGSMFCGIEF